MSELATAPQTEVLPSLSPVFQAELARIEAEAAAKVAEVIEHYERKLAEARGDEAFGANDEVLAPSTRRALTHHDYHAQRPSEGIIRDGSLFRNASTGAEATAKEYDAQIGTADAHYDAIGGLNNEVEISESPDFKKMNIHELALASGKASMIGDIAVSNEVRQTFVQLLENALKDPESGVTEKEYKDEIARFDHLVELAEAQQKAKDPEYAALVDKAMGANEMQPAETKAETELPAEETEQVIAVEAQDVTPPEEVVTPKLAEEESAEVEAIEAEAVDPETEVIEVEAEKAEHKVGEGATYNGEPVTVGEPVFTENGIEYPVTKADGSTEVVNADDLVFEAKEKGASLKERAKEWWGKNAKLSKLPYTYAYMGERWSTMMNWVANGGAKELDSPEEKEKKAQRNRIYKLAGLSAVVLFVATKDIHGFLHIPSGNGLDLANSVPSHSGSGNTLSAHDQSVFDSMHPSTTDAAPVLAPSPEAAVPVEPQIGSPDVLTSNPGFNIGNGEGGAQLFNSLNLDPSKWYANQESFLSKFPKDFYRMDDGGVGLARVGRLSQAAQDAISALR